jgi:hypothetical protein
VPVVLASNDGVNDADARVAGFAATLLLGSGGPQLDAAAGVIADVTRRHNR